MATYAWPFDSNVTLDGNNNPVYDRAISSDTLSAILRRFFSDGVFMSSADALQVTAVSGMTLSLAVGNAHIQGKCWGTDAAISITIEAANSQPRYDRIVLRRDNNSGVRNIYPLVIKGTPATSPAVPAQTRTSLIYDITLAYVYVGANVNSISQGNITDKRNSTECGAVVSINAEINNALAGIQADVAACQSATSSATSAATSANGAATSANTAAGNAQDAADAITGITVGATAVAYGNPPTAVVTEDPGDGHLNVAFGLPTGATGIRGTVTYSGTAITGTSTTPTAYATGISNAIAGDLYHYNGVDTYNSGNEYRCTVGGNAATARWVYNRNVGGIPVGSTEPTGEQLAWVDTSEEPPEAYDLTADMVAEDGGGSVQDALDAHTSQLADVAPKTNNRNWIYEGRDLKALFGTALAFRTAVAAGNFDNIRIGDYWPISLSGTFRDVGAYTCPSGTTYYSDTGLTTSVGTTGKAYEATYVNATYCSISISSTTYYVSTAACLAYFVRTLSNAVVNLEVAGINLYYNHGDTALAVPHILFCPRDCLPVSCRMRKTDAIWHSEATTSPWLGSAMYATLNDVTYGLLPLIAATDIGAYIYAGPNSAGMRTMLPDMATGVSTPTGWAWRDRGKLFIPMEKEVWGTAVWASHANHQALSVQWPIFIGTLRHIVKGAGNAGSRTNWWCATATSATYFAYVSGDGRPNIHGAADAYNVAFCFLVA